MLSAAIAVMARYCDISATFYANTAHAGEGTFTGTFNSLEDAALKLDANSSVTFAGQLSHTGVQILALDGDNGYARLWVDDHLLIDQNLAPPSPPRCADPGGDPAPVPGFLRFAADLPTNGPDDPHSMREDGGDCVSGCSPEVCVELCTKLVRKGCVGFVTEQANPFRVCYMRKLAGGDCGGELVSSTQYTAYVRPDTFQCKIAPEFCPAAAGQKGGPATADYAIQIPFLPGAASAKLRLELTVAGSHPPTRLRLLANGTEIPASAFSAVVAPAEARYHAERAKAEVGWNTWVSGDMLTHALLPEGIAVSLSLQVGDATVEGLGGLGPSCNATKFPVEHGLHSTRGEYTEIASVAVGASSFRIESATIGEDGLDLVLLVTALTGPGPIQTTGDTKSDIRAANVSLGVPPPFGPRICDTWAVGGSAKNTSGRMLAANCPGLRSVEVLALSRAVRGNCDRGEASTFELALPATGGQAALLITAGGGTPYSLSVAAAASAVAAARSKLISSFAKFESHNETYAGMSTAIAWNVIYTPYEGIFTPVFRGSPWPVSKPHNYVLFEWDTYLAAIIASVTDPWVARSNIIRMTKSLNYKGFVAGFWNGLCGEVDKSKPPVGSIALEHLVARDPDALWLVDLLLPQLLMWNRWWAAARQFAVGGGGGKGQKNVSAGLLAPGSTRQYMNLAIDCANQSPVSASRCETGLDNSPLYDGAQFVSSEDVIDSVDVGMTSLYARDSQALAALSSKVNSLPGAASELRARAATTLATINSATWNESEGIYLNRMWQTGEWSPRDGKTGAAVIGPPNLYPLLARAPSDSQVSRMMSRFLTNSSEFGVAPGVPHGMPSISRTSSAFADNSYWRGRAWGPMNFLVYIGLAEYKHLPAVRSAMSELARQSEATFLVEWMAHHRVMENYNSVTGKGCDVWNAIPFYHWGGLMALVALMDIGLA